jgi:4-amino-4-deoxy-L-arabinose transferase-like glycosyltransferase
MDEPAAPLPAAPAFPPGPVRLPAGLGRVDRLDLRNLIWIVLGGLAVLLLVSPQHEFPTTDDYLYAGSVRDMLATGRFIMPDFSQANLFGLTVWGAGWARVFGFSFTSLTFSTLVWALIGLVAFYGLARRLGVGPGGALFGTALLGLDPLFVHLSYSFMTDVPFLGAVLLACYCYVRGIQEDRLGWVVAGGLFAGYAYLIRQFGALVPLAFGAYLVLNGLWARRAQWRALVVTVVVPGLVMLLWWWFWTRVHPPTGAAGAAGARAAAFIGQPVWPQVFLLRAFCLLPLTALCAPAALPLPRRRWWLVGVLAVVVLGAIYIVDDPARIWIGIEDPPFTAHFGPLSYDLPQQPFSFADVGNIVKRDGFDFDEFGYDQLPIWSVEAWRALWMAGLGLGIVLLARIGWSLWDGGRAARARAPLGPEVALYLLGALTWGVSIGILGDLFDRYVLAFLPFVILFIVRGAGAWGRWAWGYSLAALALVAFFTLLAEADYLDHNNTRWAAARWVEAQTGQVHAGWNWDHWGHADSAQYHVVNTPTEGWVPARAFPYLSRLAGFTTRFVYAESAPGAPPLRSGP